MKLTFEGMSESVPSRVLETFEASMGQAICIKIFHTRSLEGKRFELIDGRFGLHLTPFCLAVKEQADVACRACDLSQVPARCQRERKIFVHTCHAGAKEMILPVFWEEELALVVYVGQFRTNPTGPASLPILRSKDLRHLRDLGAGLQAYLALLLENSRHHEAHPREFRRSAIESYLARNLRANPSLKQLSAELNLSPSRCRHLVKEVCGCSFVELKDRLRLARAKTLLRCSDYKIASVADECGFADPLYFYRFFRRKSGRTPAAFRRSESPLGA